MDNLTQTWVSALQDTASTMHPPSAVVVPAPKPPTPTPAPVTFMTMPRAAPPIVPKPFVMSAPPGSPVPPPFKQQALFVNQGGRTLFAPNLAKVPAEPVPGPSPAPSPATSPQTPDATVPGPTKWYANAALQQVAAVVGVFLVSFIVLVAIRPPFTFAKPKTPLETDKFSAARAAMGALGAAVLTGVILGVLAIVRANKK